MDPALPQVRSSCRPKLPSIRLTAAETSELNNVTMVRIAAGVFAGIVFAILALRTARKGSR